MNKRINNAILKGISYLEKRQKRNGSFESLTSSDLNFSNSKSTSSLFPTCLIFSALNSIEAPKIKNKTKNFLLSQKSENWSFNYWKRNSLESKKFPYPDDLDDTFCALSGLFLNDKKTIDGESLAKIIKLLAFCEQKEGGPYFTWIVPPDSSSSWRDVDLAVNSNIAFFLFLQEIQLPSLNNLIEQAISKNKFVSPYYASEYSVIYFISRFYQGKLKEKLIEEILARRNSKGYWENHLNTSLAVSALINLGIKSKNYLSKAILHILKNQKNDGHWNPLPFTIELVKNKKNYFSGSRDLTAALCLETLKKYDDLNPEKQAASRLEIKLKERIIKKTAQLFKFESESEKKFQNLIKKINSNDKTIEIALLPYYFKTALGKNGKSISKANIEKLGSATILGWIAYTIYDHFIDKEATENDSIPIANTCLRKLIEIFAELIPNQLRDKSLFNSLMDRIEAANIWEIENCRFKIKNNDLQVPEKLPDFEKGFLRISEKSIAHVLGPVFIFLLKGFGENSKEVKNIINFYRFYICAKQLSDDSHDWEKDLLNGQITPVTAMVIEKFKSINPENKINLKKDIEKLRKIFWYEVVAEISKVIIENIQTAKQTLKMITVVEKPQVLEEPLNSIKKIANETIEKQRDAIVFLKNI